MITNSEELKKAKRTVDTLHKELFLLTLCASIGMVKVDMTPELSDKFDLFESLKKQIPEYESSIWTDTDT